MAAEPRKTPDWRPCVLHVVTASINVTLMRGQLKFLSEAGFEVVVAAAPGEELAATTRAEGAQAIEVPMTREITPLRDLVSLFRLSTALRRIRPVIINFGTPKAGLLAGLAALLSGVPCRVYMLRGLRAETTAGIKRRLLLLCERVACACAHRVICVSESLRQKVVSLEIVDPERTVVLGSGSSNGVDPEAFAPNVERVQAALTWREENGIPKGARIIGFVGRFVVDKGIEDLLEAFSRLRERFPDLRLLLVGEFEEGDPLPAAVRGRLRMDPQVIITGFVRNTAVFYQVMDVLVLPTRREGFPTVILQAGAAARPVVAYRATGTVDAVIDGTTGILVAPGNAVNLALALESLLEKPCEAERMGRAGRERVLREFRQTLVWESIAHAYVQLLREKGLPIPDAVTRRSDKPIVSNEEAIA